MSIIMPVYNAENFLDQAIQSILDQSYPFWELLIINDGSTDNSREVIQLFSDKRIRYFQQVNNGVSDARNVGLQHMKGEYFCFLDADDVLPPCSLQSRLSLFEKNQRIEFADGKVEYYNNDFTNKIKSWTPDFTGNPLQDLLSLSGRSFLGNTWMIRRQPGNNYAFKKGLTHGEDLLFYITIARNGGEYCYTTEAILHYRTGHASAMTNLQGLEEGYFQIDSEIQQMDDIPAAWKKQYYSKIKSIMLKCYLGKGEVFNALRVIIR